METSSPNKQPLFPPVAGTFDGKGRNFIPAVMRLTRAQELRSPTHPSPSVHNFNGVNINTNNLLLNPGKPLRFPVSSPMSISLFPPLSLSHLPFLPAHTKAHQTPRPIRLPMCVDTFVEHLACDAQETPRLPAGGELEPDPVDSDEKGVPLGVEVKELEETPEQWRRAKMAWLCQELPRQRSVLVAKLLGVHKKWLRQEDATYLVVHFLRARRIATAFKVYKWMVGQHWYKFDFALATEVADQLGKEQKPLQCREVFDDIVNENRVPSESTFHFLVVAYLGVASMEGSLEKACGIFYRMVHLGGYRPQLSLHYSLFKALLSKPASSAKHYLEQAEFIYNNLVTSGLKVQKDIYGGLIWLHSHQDTVNKERIMSLRKEMYQAGIRESKEILVSLLRASSKVGDVEEADRICLKLLEFDEDLPPEAYLCKMELCANVGQAMMSLEIFRKMQKRLGSSNLAAYQKIIEMLCKANKTELAESLMQELIESGMNPLIPSFIHMLNMYSSLSLHDNLESMFSDYLEKCPPNHTIYSIYLDSLVKAGKLDRAEEIFKYMYTNMNLGVDAKSCNTILGGYLSSGDHAKAGKVYDLMHQKQFDVESSLMEKLEFALSLRDEKKEAKILSLSKEQREILVGLMLGGLQVQSVGKKKHVVYFEFRENLVMHSVLRKHLYNQFREWLNPACILKHGSEDIPYRYFTIPHFHFGFFAGRFWPGGQPTIPKLVCRWLSPVVLAYWYMYGGHRTPSGDILLKLRGSSEGVGYIVKAFEARSLNCKVKRKGKVYWIGFLGNDSKPFWKLIEPCVLEDLKESTDAGSQTSDNNLVGTQTLNSDSGSDLDEDVSST